MSTSAPTLLKELLAVQQEIPAIPKDKHNTYYDSWYTDLASLINAARPVLVQHGLVVTQLVGGTGENPTLTTILAHPESGETIQSEMPLLIPGDKRHSQGIGSAITYARRYAYGALLGLVAEDDDDGQSGSTVAQRPAPAYAGPPPAGPAPGPGMGGFPPPGQGQPPSAAAQVASRAATVGPRQDTGEMSTEPQKGNIRRLFMVTKQEHGWSREDWGNQVELATGGATRDDRQITKSQASNLIKSVKTLIGEVDAPQAQQQAPQQPEFAEQGDYGYSEKPF